MYALVHTLAPLAGPLQVCGDPSETERKRMAPTIRLGVIGCGSIAYWVHLRIARRTRGAVLVSAADPDEDARKRAGQLAGIPVHASTNELLERRDIDAVIVSGPTHLHAELAIAACDAGKHVYLEKPLASSAADGARVVEAANRSGVTVALGFNRRFHPLHEQARSLIREGRIGHVRAVQSTFCERSQAGELPEWKRRRSTGGGVLLDLASHHIDLARWYLDDEVASAHAALQSEASEHDSARLDLAMRSGTQVQSWFSFRTATSDWLEFSGELGTLRVDRHRAGISLRVPRRFGYGVRSARIAPTAPLAVWQLQRIVRPSAESSYARALDAFVGTLRGERREMAGLDDGLKALEVVEAAEESARAGAPVECK